MIKYYGFSVFHFKINHNRKHCPLYAQAPIAKQADYLQYTAMADANASAIAQRVEKPSGAVAPKAPLCKGSCHILR